IRVSRTHWQRERFACIERFWTLGVLMSFAGGLVGVYLQRRKKIFLKRLQKLSRHRLDQARSRRAAFERHLTQNHLAVTREAMSFAERGLVLLDNRQCLIAFNAQAAELLQISNRSIGRHWLDLQSHPQWAGALGRSLTQPDTVVDFSPPDRTQEVSLV